MKMFQHKFFYEKYYVDIFYMIFLWRITGEGKLWNLSLIYLSQYNDNSYSYLLSRFIIYVETALEIVCLLIFSCKWIFTSFQPSFKFIMEASYHKYAQNTFDIECNDDYFFLHNFSVRSMFVVADFMNCGILAIYQLNNLTKQT